MYRLFKNVFFRFISFFFFFFLDFLERVIRSVLFERFFVLRDQRQATRTSTLREISRVKSKGDGRRGRVGGRPVGNLFCF